MRTFASLLLLGACAVRPQPGETVRVQVIHIVTPAQVARGAALVAADPAALAAGRIASVRCAMGADSFALSYVTLPPGLDAQRGTVLVARAGDASSIPNARPGEALGLAPAPAPVHRVHGDSVVACRD
jgi:hypothetical protein